MRFIRNIEFRNLFLDLVVTLIAFKYIDISGFVEGTLDWVVYLIVLLQSFAIFLLWGDETILEFIDDPEHPTFIENTKYKLTNWLRHFAMFSWALVCFWIVIPIYHLRAQTEQDFRWAVRVSVVVCLATGLVLMIRFMSTNVESDDIKKWRRKADSEKKPFERIFIPLYEFLIYKNIGNKSFRYWLAYIIVSGFLIYTETMFEVLTLGASVSLYYIIPAIFFSYLPMRLLLVVKPPFSLIELATAFVAFGVFVYMLFF